MTEIAVVGGGSYGTCLAVLFGKAGHAVTFYVRNPATAADLEATRVNASYLPGHQLPAGVTVTSDLEAAVTGKQFVLGVTPSHGIRDVLGRAARWMDPDAIVINASKGLEEGTHLTIDKVYAEILPARIAARATYLSGPTFAGEIAAGTPAAIVLAGNDAESRLAAQTTLGTLHFRIYTSDDVVGVLLGGALKNVIAIGAGVSDGLGFGSNSRVALITRGLAEMTRIGVAMGAHPQTFAGLSGMGDLVLTCMGDASRNRRVGLALGQGKTMAEILGEMKMVAEGVKTAAVAHELAAKLGVDAPIIDAMHGALHGGVGMRETISRLLSRVPKAERDWAKSGYNPGRPMLGYVLDDLFGEHRAPSGHPERAARVEAVRDALRGAHLAERATHVPIRAATDEELARVHAGAYLDELVAAVPGKSGWLDADTYFSPGTWDAARAAAGSAAQLATSVLAGALEQGLAVVRPPGHHATRERAMGFCLLNNVAVAAAAARAAGAARVAIVDWDVHHGNGTQDIFWDDPSVLYMSVHQYPYYPGTGAATEVGGPHAKGATVNVGLPRGSGDADYAAVFDHVFLPALAKFAPDLILVSAGFDAYEHDPLAGMRVTHAGFRAMAQRLRAAAARLCGGRIVALLEGGYDLDGLAGGMVATLDAFVAPVETARIVPLPSGLARAAIDAALAAQAAAGNPLPEAA